MTTVVISALISPAFVLLRLPNYFMLLPPLLAIPIGLLTSLGSARYRIEQKRRDRGQCIKCGYDLRATTGRCPECGKQFRRV